MAKPSTPSKIVFILSLRNERRGDGRVVVRSGGDVAVVAMAMCLAVAVVIKNLPLQRVQMVVVDVAP